MSNNKLTNKLFMDSKEWKDIFNNQKPINSNIKKTYILDTSVLLHDPESLFKFEDNIIIITKTILEELNNKKTLNSYIGRNAREVIRNLEKIVDNKGLIQNINDHGKLIFYKLQNKLSQDRNRLNDYKIIEAVKNTKSILVTKDKMLKVIAKSDCIEVQNYKNDQIKNIIDDGYENKECNKKLIDDLYKKSYIETPKELFDKNYYYILNSYNSSALAKTIDSNIKIVKEQTVHGISPKNVEQTFALDALMDHSQDLVTLTGPAGTGKTLLALAAGLEQVVEQKTYKRVLVARPTIGVEDMGYLPGTIEEKMAPWMQPIMDNLDFLYQDLEPEEVANEYKDRNKLKIEPLAYIRGRSIPKQFFIVDEAQNLSPQKLKTILTRAGKFTKIILTGDPSQIDSPYLDERSNGLSYVIDKFKNEDNFTQIKLKNTERSRLAAQSAKLL